MAYPRELLLDADTEQRLISYIESELLNHYQERSVWMNRLLQWQRDYWAEPTTKEATFPFKGAATIVIPLTAIALEAVHARSMTTLFALNQLVSAVPRHPYWTNHARPVEMFMNNELIRNMEAKRKLGSAILELEKFGTGIGKVGYENIVRKAVRINAAGEEEEFPVTVRRGACVDSVAFGRFLMPFASTDPQTTPWVGEEHSETPFQVKVLEESGFFREGTVERLRSWIGERSRSTTGVERQLKTEQEKLEKREAQWPNELDWNELWLGFDVDGDGVDEEIVVHFHRGAQFLMSVRYNPHDDLHRPYRYGNYFPVEHRWTGIGICKQNDQFQREITMQHRQRLDNGTIANMRMFKISKLSGYGPGEPIFPGKMWFVDDMAHVDVMQMGDVNQSAFSNEQASLMYSQQRTGVNEVTLGMPQQGTPGTATGDLARIQEGAKKFDFAYGNIKDFLGDILNDSAAMIAQYGPRHIDYVRLVEHGDLVREFFTQPVEHIRNGLLIQLSIAGQQQNKILDRQTWLETSQMLQQYYVGMIQLAQLLGDQQLLQYIAQKGIVAGTEAIRQALETFDHRNVDRMVLSELMDRLAGAPNNAALGGGNGSGLPVGRGAGGPAATGQVPGMDQLASLVSLLGNGSGQGVRELLNTGRGV